MHLTLGLEPQIDLVVEVQIPWRKGGVICEMNGFLSQRKKCGHVCVHKHASVCSCLCVGYRGDFWDKKAVFN